MTDEEKTKWLLANEYHRMRRLKQDIAAWKAAHDGEAPSLLQALRVIAYDRWIETFLDWEPNRLELHRPN